MLNFEQLPKIADFFASQNFTCGMVGDYEHSFAVHSRLFYIVFDREQTLTLPTLEGEAAVANAQLTATLRLASVYFCFNRFDLCSELIISAWNLPLHDKQSMLASLPKGPAESEFTLFLFACLYARRGKHFTHQVMPNP